MLWIGICIGLLLSRFKKERLLKTKII